MNPLDITSSIIAAVLAAVILFIWVHVLSEDDDDNGPRTA